MKEGGVYFFDVADGLFGIARGVLLHGEVGTKVLLAGSEGLPEWKFKVVLFFVGEQKYQFFQVPKEYQGQLDLILRANSQMFDISNEVEDESAIVQLVH